LHSSDRLPPRKPSSAASPAVDTPRNQAYFSMLYRIGIPSGADGAPVPTDMKTAGARFLSRIEDS